MIVTVILDGRRKKIELASGSTVRDAAVKTGVCSEECLASVNNEITPDDECLSSSDKIEFFKVVSGG